LRKYVLLAAVLLAVLAGMWVHRQWFPPAELAIKNRLLALASLASFSPQEAPLARLANAGRLVDFFARDIDIRLPEAPPGLARLSGRDNLREIILGARGQAQKMSVHFPDIQVAVDPDGESAVAGVTVVVDVNTEANAMIQELRITLRKEGGAWLVARVESLKALDR
jgi:hypothetical protein